MRRPSLRWTSDAEVGYRTLSNCPQPRLGPGQPIPAFSAEAEGDADLVDQKRPAVG